jgi:hypothetical protein
VIELNTNVDLESANEIGKYSDKIIFCRKFRNLGTCFI